ncbi:hypothetical protein K6119_07855 [Paracrocinitomix mangrovi]|uniref:hypothetical protein n=1 Tax=Paracrocinitomix mangrovi TaxID=2862509 RepID=UPI001C8EA1E2|nr:hypothetical protein [Paracrocinitomix mangrovi]UKN03428.1 hypothetical protein K6119_07855 [Paracrocinitomix mangrovi]
MKKIGGYLLMISLAVIPACGDTDTANVPEQLPEIAYDNPSKVSEDVLIDDVCELRSELDFHLLPEQWVIHHNIKSDDFQNFMPGHKMTKEWFDVSDNLQYVDQLKMYQSLFITNPKGDRFIDLDSYSLNIEKRGNTLVSPGGEVDTQVQIVSKDWRVLEVLFLGPAVTIEDAVWINDSECWILTIEEYNSQFFPTVIMINLDDKCMQSVISKSETDQNRTAYNLQYRWKEIEFLD